MRRVASVGWAVRTGRTSSRAGSSAQLVVADPGIAQAPDGVGERLPRHAPLVLVLAPAPQPVMLLGDVRELEEERERAQHGGLLLELQRVDRLLELRAVARLAGVASLAADALLEREQLLSSLLDQHLAEHVAEQPDVGAQLRVGRAHTATLVADFTS